jgi:outer membrane protein
LLTDLLFRPPVRRATIGFSTAFLCLLCVAIPTPACAQTEPAPAEGNPAGWSGTAGAGPIVFPRYTGGRAFETLPVPILSVQYKETVYVELIRAGVYLWSSQDKKMGLGLAAEPRLGFHASDGALLNGMATRRHSIEAGPSFDWETKVISLNVSYFNDVTHASRGNSLRVSLYKDLVKNQQWTLGALLGASRLSSRVANYYFGVQAAEATASRPYFQPGADTNIVYGVDGSYKIDKGHTAVFGINTTQLTGNAANSPIVQTRQATLLWLGYAWNL